MVRKGFKMKLYPDMAEEYEKRHNELWPEMKEMIHEYRKLVQVQILQIQIRFIISLAL